MSVLCLLLNWCHIWILLLDVLILAGRKLGLLLINLLQVLRLNSGDLLILVLLSSLNFSLSQCLVLSLNNGLLLLYNFDLMAFKVLWMYLVLLHIILLTAYILCYYIISALYLTIVTFISNRTLHYWRLICLLLAHLLLYLSNLN